jgi:hypothetical protein
MAVKRVLGNQFCKLRKTVQNDRGEAQRSRFCPQKTRRMLQHKSAIKSRC